MAGDRHRPAGARRPARADAGGRPRLPGPRGRRDPADRGAPRASTPGRSRSRARPWTDQQWLAQVLLASAIRAGGWELLAVVRAGLIAVVMGFTLASSMARGAGHRTAAVLALARVRARRAGARAAAPAVRDRDLRGAPVARGDPRGPSASTLARARCSSCCGRTCTARSCSRRSSSATRGWTTLLADGRGAPTLAVLVVGVARDARQPVRAGAWAYAAGIGANPAITERVTEWQRTTPLSVPGVAVLPRRRSAR